ncbi:MAG: acyl-CoA dehydrogenase family protein, partial [Candidatus Omnitrophica bacterium]|nr:acyl-CoA dehydrogenase family protein [Candidatus Omnitrophota bacterium]
MDFTFTDEQKLLQETVQKFVEKELKPIAAQIDREHEVPRQVLTQMGELGFFGVSVPAEYGGAEMGEIGHCIVGEEVARGCASTSVIMGAHVALAITSILLDGSPAQRQKYLPPMVLGKWLGCFALTEPGAGSDAASIETRAVRDGDSYVLNGTKTFITNGSIADVIVLFAVTDKALGPRGGVTAFIVEKGMKGFRPGKVDAKMGIRGSPTTELIFEDVRVPKDNVLGQVGYGFATAMKTLDRGRLSLAAGCLGGCKELLSVSAKYAIQRVQFGKPIA